MARPPPSPGPVGDLNLLLEVLPAPVRAALDALGRNTELVEVVLDLGRAPEARFPLEGVRLLEEPVTREDLQHVTARVSAFGKDNRAGIERTLHRISAIRNRQADIVGLTCRVGRAVFGTVDILRDVIESGASILLLGRPGVGKTTLLREAARVLADELHKRVIIVDTSNEIAGDGDIPHPGIGLARRMQVAEPAMQHAVMIEAVENHMPQVIVIDEIGTEAESRAARTIAERGVQLIATAHGTNLDTLIKNPTLEDLVGGIQAVTLSDEEARRRDTQKTVLERKASPTFTVVIELREQGRLAVHHDVGSVVDAQLRGLTLDPELRVRAADGRFTVEPGPQSPPPNTRGYDPLQQHTREAPGGEGKRRKRVRVFPFALARQRLERAIKELNAPAIIVDYVNDADAILTLRSQEKRLPGKVRNAEAKGTPVYALRGNSVGQMLVVLRELCGMTGPDQPLPDDGIQR